MRRSLLEAICFILLLSTPMLLETWSICSSSAPRVRGKVRGRARVRASLTSDMSAAPIIRFCEARVRARVRVKVRVRVRVRLRVRACLLGPAGWAASAVALPGASSAARPG